MLVARCVGRTNGSDCAALKSEAVGQSDVLEDESGAAGGREGPRPGASIYGEAAAAQSQRSTGANQGDGRRQAATMPRVGA